MSRFPRVCSEPCSSVLLRHLGQIRRRLFGTNFLTQMRAGLTLSLSRGR